MKNKLCIISAIISASFPIFGMERAVICSWPSGNIIFAITVQPGQNKIDKTLSDGVGTVRIIIDDLAPKYITGIVELREKGQVTHEKAKCRSVTE